MGMWIPNVAFNLFSCSVMALMQEPKIQPKNYYFSLRNLDCSAKSQEFCFGLMRFCAKMQDTLNIHKLPVFLTVCSILFFTYLIFQLRKFR